MSTTTNRRKSVIATIAAALVAPAMLFLGTGTAQAASNLETTSDALGVTVKITSTGSAGLCHYTAEPWFGWAVVKPLPVYNVPFLLQGGESYNLWFPGIQTGATWKAKVECPIGGTDYFNPVY